MFPAASYAGIIKPGIDKAPSNKPRTVNPERSFRHIRFLQLHIHFFGLNLYVRFALYLWSVFGCEKRGCSKTHRPHKAKKYLIALMKNGAANILKIAISWRANWANLSTYFKYPESVRTLIYATDTIEGFNRQLRKVTKNKSVFPTDDSLLKMLYLAMIDITKKWTGKRKDWGQIHSQLEIFFADRLPQ